MFIGTENEERARYAKICIIPEKVLLRSKKNMVFLTGMRTNSRIKRISFTEGVK